MKFYDIVVETDLWGFYDEACVSRLLCYSAAKFLNYYDDYFKKE